MRNNHANQIAPPNVLIDRVTFGLTGSAICESTVAPVELAARLAEFSPAVRVTTPKSKRGDPGYCQVTFDLEEENGPSVGVARLDLHFVNRATGLHLGERTALQLNPQKWLRPILGGAAGCGPLAFDGSSNLLGHGQDRGDLRAEQLERVEQAVEYVLDALTAALPDGEWRWKKLWLKGAEACRDLQVDDAVPLVRRVQHAALTRTTEILRDAYRAGAVDAGGIPSVRWKEGPNKAEHKVYAKRRDTVRLEVSCPGREAIVGLTGRASANVTPCGASDLLRQFSEAALPVLDRMERHVETALAGRGRPEELFVALAPLNALSAGRKSNSGPAPRPASVQAARVAMGALISVGAYNATNIPAGHSVRRALDGMTGDNGPLVSAAGSSVYCLHPKFAGAAQALSALGSAS